MRRIYEKVNTDYLLKIHEELVEGIYSYLPKSKHRWLDELLETERELTLREDN